MSDVLAEERTRALPAVLTDFAPAKINLTLRVIGRRSDGYHELESLVAFADVGDRVSLRAEDALSLSLGGPTAKASGALEDNLVLKAARAFTARFEGTRSGRFTLTKALPVAAGLGGGSSDAAAALRLLARLNGLPLDHEAVGAVARETGADVPVCLDPRPRVMRGIGDKLSQPLAPTPLPTVLVNPRVAVPTKDVFARLAAMRGSTVHVSDPPPHASNDNVPLDTVLEETGNDLEAPAIALQPIIAEVLAALASQPACRRARMSGSGATCFALFPSARAAAAAARQLRSQHPGWWVRACVLNKP